MSARRTSEMPERVSGFNSQFRVGDRVVGSDAPVLIIAEAGVSHFGDMTLAFDLVDLAAELGADVFKTQFFDVDNLYAERAAAWRDRLRPRNLDLDQARQLADRCRQRGILFMSTAHDESRVSWLKELDVPAIKVGSGERNNPSFLKALAGLGRPMIVSTGMYNAADVSEALEACAEGGCRDVALLHCVTSYPTPDSQVNLAAMDRLREIFDGPVGYSDHTDGFLAPYAAVARGAKVVEEHITILRDVPNAQDWKVSAGPDNFKRFVTELRQIEAMIGDGQKGPAPCEVSAMNWALKSLVAAQDLSAGHRLTEKDLVAKRPGDAVPPNRIADLIGGVLIKSVRADSPILPENVKSR